MNLLQNSLKYTKAGGNIHICAEIIKEAQNQKEVNKMIKQRQK